MTQQQNEEQYFRGLSTFRQLEYIRSTWGVEVGFSINYISLGPKRSRMVITVDVPNMVHRAELMDPPRYEKTVIIRRSLEVAEDLTGALWSWLAQTQAHMDQMSRLP